jgi:hypothetical protein
MRKHSMAVPDFWTYKGRFSKGAIKQVPDQPTAKKSEVWMPRDMRRRGKK